MNRKVFSLIEDDLCELEEVIVWIRDRVSYLKKEVVPMKNLRDIEFMLSVVEEEEFPGEYWKGLRDGLEWMKSSKSLQEITNSISYPNYNFF